MQVGIFNCLFIFVIAALNDYVIVASIIVIAIRNSINCAALTVGLLDYDKNHNHDYFGQYCNHDYLTRLLAGRITKKMF